MLTRICALLFVLGVSLFSDAEPINSSITIYSDGTRLAGNLWIPEDFKSGQRRPGILLVHGWGGLKSHLNEAYAPQFAAQGYVVLTFDYTGWGESEGVLMRVGPRPESADGAETPQTYTTQVQEIRRQVNPLEQMDDIRAAFAYLTTSPQVDPERIAIWGSSLGGGLALATASEFPQIKVLMSQVGSVNPQGDRAGDSEDSPLSAANVAIWRGAIARGDQPSFPSDATPGLQGYPDWPDFVRYDPLENLSQLQAATLIIDADQEELFDIQIHGVALFERIKDRVPAKYDTIKGKHYDVYRGVGYAKALGLQKAWLDEHLPVE
jgi:uncharacterized protein